MVNLFTSESAFCQWVQRCTSLLVVVIVLRYLPAPAGASEFTVELYVKKRSILKASAASYKLARNRAAEAAYWQFEKLLGPAP